MSLEDWSDYFVHSSACNDSALQIADTVYSRVRELIYNKRQFNLTNQKIKITYVMLPISIVALGYFFLSYGKSIKSVNR